MQITTDFCSIPGMKRVHIGVRIAELRERAGLNQSDLARILGIKPQAVQKWEAGKATPRASKFKPLATALSTSVRELVRGTDVEEIPDSGTFKETNAGRVLLLRGAKGGAPKNESGFLPLISWVQAVEWGPGMGNFRPEEAEDWIRCPFDHGPAAFILEIAGESNFDPTGPKSYAPGDFIAVDPGRVPANRSMVVVRIDHDERAQLKQLLMDESGMKLLRNLNPHWPGGIVPLSDNSRIVGVVIGKWVPE
jgi:SOS-response transcriptional repressor LexA